MTDERKTEGYIESLLQTLLSLREIILRYDQEPSAWAAEIDDACEVFNNITGLPCSYEDLIRTTADDVLEAIQ